MNKEDETEILKGKTALEVSVQEQQCAYLGCNNIGTNLDDVEVATGITEKQYVCKKHVGQLTQHIICEGRKLGGISFPWDSTRINIR